MFVQFGAGRAADLFPVGEDRIPDRPHGVLVVQFVQRFRLVVGAVAADHHQPTPTRGIPAPARSSSA